MSDRFGKVYAAVADERQRCTDEREAFRAFRAALAKIDTGGRGGGVPAGGAPSTPTAVHAVGASGQGADDAVRRVCEAYQRTVMGVPHCAEDYGDSLSESLGEEFGADVAAAIAGASVVTPDLRDALDDAAATAETERDEFVALLDREESSVRSIDEALDAITDRIDAIGEEPPSDCGFDELRTRYETVSELRRRLDELAADRQATLADHRRTLSDPEPSVTGFLYSDVDGDFPVLAGIAETGDRVDAVESRVTYHLSRRC